MQVHLCLQYEEFFVRAEALFNACDLRGSGRANQGLLQFVTHEFISTTRAGVATEARQLLERELSTLLMGQSSPRESAPFDDDDTMSASAFYVALFESSIARHPAALAAVAAVEHPNIC